MSSHKLKDRVTQHQMQTITYREFQRSSREEIQKKLLEHKVIFIVGYGIPIKISLAELS